MLKKPTAKSLLGRPLHLYLIVLPVGSGFLVRIRTAGRLPGCLQQVLIGDWAGCAGVWTVAAAGWS